MHYYRTRSRSSDVISTFLIDQHNTRNRDCLVYNVNRLEILYRPMNTEKLFLNVTTIVGRKILNTVHTVTFLSKLGLAPQYLFMYGLWRASCPEFHASRDEAPRHGEKYITPIEKY